MQYVSFYQLFIFIGRRDFIVCVWCKKSLGEWHPDEDPSDPIYHDHQCRFRSDGGPQRQDTSHQVEVSPSSGYATPSMPTTSTACSTSQGDINF